MKAMIFAAGEGRRMRPLTLAIPKPLLKVGEKSLLAHLIQRLLNAGVTEFVINVSYLAYQVIAALDQIDFKGGTSYVSVEETPLETGGGLKRALPYLGDEPFLLVNSDVWSEIDFESLIQHAGRLDGQDFLAHLVLVDNPLHNSKGDFLLDEQRYVSQIENESAAGEKLTFSGISILHPELLKCFDDGREVFPLRDLLTKAMSRGLVTGEHFGGYWSDVGTPERLKAVRLRYEGGEN